MVYQQHTVYQQHCTSSGKRCALLVLIYSTTLTEIRWVYCQLLVCREYPFSSRLVIEWEAAGNISKCKLTFNYTKISFRDHFSFQADSDLLKHFPFYVDSSFPKFWGQLEMNPTQSWILISFLLFLPNTVFWWHSCLQNHVHFWDVPKSWHTCWQSQNADIFQYLYHKIIFVRVLPTREESWAQNARK